MLESRIRPRCQSLMKGLFLNGHANTVGLEHLHSVQRQYGIERLEVIKARSDAKVVARGTHGEWGRVALKAVDPIANSVAANSVYHTDRIVAGRPAPFLPKLHAYGVGYSISEWIDGRVVKDMRPADGLDVAPFITFFDALGTWCERSTHDGPLSTAEIHSIVRFYIETTVRRMQYQSTSNCVSSCVKFLKDEKRLRSYIDDMNTLAPMLSLPRTDMLSDLNAGNLVLDRARGRLMMIDHEALRPGSYLFDMVFFVASLIAARLPAELTSDLAERVLSDEFMPSETAERFFRSLASYVVETFMTIDGRRRRDIEQGVEMIQPV